MGVGKGGASEPNEPSLDPPLVYVCVIRILDSNYHMFCSQNETMSSLQRWRPEWSAQTSHVVTDTGWQLH